MGQMPTRTGKVPSYRVLGGRRDLEGQLQGNGDFAMLTLFSKPLSGRLHKVQGSLLGPTAGSSTPSFYSLKASVSTAQVKLWLFRKNFVQEPESTPWQTARAWIWNALLQVLSYPALSLKIIEHLTTPQGSSFATGPADDYSIPSRKAEALTHQIHNVLPL